MSENFFKSLDNQSREDVINAKDLPNPKRSVFPYGVSNIRTMNEGYLIPLDCFFTLPGDGIDIDYVAYLESLNPFVDRQYSGMKLSVHVYYQKCEHEWLGWKNYATRGRRGNISLTLPYIQVNDLFDYLFNGQRLNELISGTTCEVDFTTPFSLPSELTGITFAHVPNGATSMTSAIKAIAEPYGLGDNTQVNRSFRSEYDTVVQPLSGGTKLNAIAFSMYQRIFRDYYLNQNLVKDNPAWFPDDDDDFVLPYAGGHCYFVNRDQSNLNYKKRFCLVPNNYKQVNNPTATDHTCDWPILSALRCRQWSGDCFTTSVPFLERNGTTNLILSTLQQATTVISSYLDSVQQLNDIPNMNQASTGAYQTLDNWIGPNNYQEYDKAAVYVTASGETHQRSLFSLLNFNQIQELATATLWSKRNADAAGDYNSLIKAHYGLSPRSEDRSATYLGGSVQRLDFNSVVSQSETTNQPLGTKTSIASSGGTAKIDHFECHDFGYVMVIASLIPDTFYTQGLRPEFDAEIVGSELPWPEFANLQKENILLKKLFYSGNSALDNKLIGFQERFLDYKYRPNRLFGHFADYLDTKFSSMSFGRFFLPSQMASFESIDNEFVTLSPYNCRSDMYSVPSQPHFVLQFGDNVRLVRCLPWASKESTLTNVA